MYLGNRAVGDLSRGNKHDTRCVVMRHGMTDLSLDVTSKHFGCVCF